MKRTEVYYEEYLRDLAQNPQSIIAYDGVKSSIQQMIASWEKQNAMNKEKDETLSSEYAQSGLKILKYYQYKLSFLEAQEREDYEEMHRIAANLNPNWLAIVSKVKVINCGRPNPEEEESIQKWWNWAKDIHREESAEEWRKNHPHFEMEFICPKKWDEMVPTNNNKVRFCEDCKKNVYFCDNIVEARELGYAGNCIGIDIGIKSKKENLQGESAFFGRPRPETIQNERDRIKPDTVSAKRLKIEYDAAMLGHFVKRSGNYSPEYMD